MHNYHLPICFPWLLIFPINETCAFERYVCLKNVTTETKYSENGFVMPMR